MLYTAIMLGETGSPVRHHREVQYLMPLNQAEFILGVSCILDFDIRSHAARVGTNRCIPSVIKILNSKEDTILLHPIQNSPHNHKRRAAV